MRILTTKSDASRLKVVDEGMNLCLQSFQAYLTTYHLELTITHRNALPSAVYDEVVESNGAINAMVMQGGGAEVRCSLCVANVDPHLVCGVCAMLAW